MSESAGGVSARRKTVDAAGAGPESPGVAGKTQTSDGVGVGGLEPGPRLQGAAPEAVHT